MMKTTWIGFLSWLRLAWLTTARKEVKTIKHSESIRVYTFVTTLLLTLLLSPLIGTVAAPKPDSPGRSVKTWDLKIRIGVIDGDDIVLTSGHEDEDGFYLFAEDGSCTGNLWDAPKEKRRGKMRAHAAQVDLFEPLGQDCGTYLWGHIPDEEDPVIFLNEIVPENDYIVYVSIGHTVTLMGNDFWNFAIQWWVEIEPQVCKMFVFNARTDPLPIEDWDPDPEGTLDDEEGWLVEFIGAEGAEAILYSNGNDLDNDGVPNDDLWRGPVSFTIKITRSPHVA